MILLAISSPSDWDVSAIVDVERQGHRCIAIYDAFPTIALGWRRNSRPKMLDSPARDKRPLPDRTRCLPEFPEEPSIAIAALRAPLLLSPTGLAAEVWVIVGGGSAGAAIGNAAMRC